MEAWVMGAKLNMQVAIIGAGVGGLNAARLLSKSGVSVEVFEARDRLRGRVLTVDATGEPCPDGVDFGASWIWLQRQPTIEELVDELELERFPQSSDGDVIFERMSRESIWRYPGLGKPPETMRLSGGTAAQVVRSRRRCPPSAST
jgi:monoamine oxidase